MYVVSRKCQKKTSEGSLRILLTETHNAFEKKKPSERPTLNAFFCIAINIKKREKNLSTNLASGGQVFSSSNIKQNDKHTKKFNKIRSRPFSKISDLKMDKYNAIQCPNHILYFFITTSSGY